VIVSDSSNSRYKSGGINFVDGKLYWVADANGPEPHDRGIFRCDPADIARPEAHAMLFNPQYEAANMIIQDGVILSSHYAPASPYATGFIISLDMGPRDLSSRWIWGGLGRNTISSSMARDRRSASTRRTATAGFEWTSDRDGSSAPRYCSSSRSKPTVLFAWDSPLNTSMQPVSACEQLIYNCQMFRWT